MERSPHPDAPYDNIATATERLNASSAQARRARQLLNKARAHLRLARLHLEEGKSPTTPDSPTDDDPGTLADSPPS